MITVTFFLWFDPAGKYNRTFVYTPRHVNEIKAKVSARLALPHEFVCVTDQSEGFDPDIRRVPIDPALIRDGKRWPKLTIFRPDAGEVIGRRILMMDIDADIVGDLDPLVDRQEEFVAWKNPNKSVRHTTMNSSLVLLTAGARRAVWETFDIEKSAELVTLDRKGGSDQAWMSRVLGDGEAMWSEKDGVYWSHDIQRVTPRNARIVFHAGWEKPERFRA